MDVTFKGTSQENGTVADDGSIAFYGSSIQEASKETLERLGIKNGVEIIELGPGKLMEAGATEGFVIQYVNDQPVGLCKGRESAYITTAGSPIGEDDWGAGYMRAVLNTLGIPGFTRVSAEALDLQSSDCDAIMRAAMDDVRREARAMALRLRNGR